MTYTHVTPYAHAMLLAAATAANAQAHPGDQQHILDNYWAHAKLLAAAAAYSQAHLRGLAAYLRQLLGPCKAIGSSSCCICVGPSYGTGSILYLR